MSCVPNKEHPDYLIFYFNVSNGDPGPVRLCTSFFARLRCFSGACAASDSAAPLQDRNLVTLHKSVCELVFPFESIKARAFNEHRINDSKLP